MFLPISRTRMRRLLPFVIAVGVLICLPAPAAATHGADVDCSDFANQAAAQTHLAAHAADPDRLDGDADGRACDSLPCPCDGATAAPGSSPTPDPAPLATLTTTARIVRAVDGDTLKVRLTTGQTARVRLIGIDTPETGKRVECGSAQATARMKKLAFRGRVGRTVTLTSDPSQDRVDRFGRLLRYVTAGGVDLGRSLVASGWARTYVFQRDFLRVAAYRRSQASARAAERGAWRACGGDFHRTR